jgi:hypothetical protein
MQPKLYDQSLTQTGALPNGAASSNTTAIDLGLNTTWADVEAEMEFEVDAPVLTTAQLANGSTMSYSVWMSATANLASPVLIYQNIIVQTGAGGVGAPAATARFKLSAEPGGPGSGLRYLFAQAINSGPGNCSGTAMILNVYV